MRRVIVLVALVGTAVLSAFFMVSAYWRARQEAVDQLYAQERILASQAAESITGYFDYYRETLEFLASNADVASDSAVGHRLLHDLFGAQQQELLSITRVNQEGRIVYTYPEEGAIGRSILDQPHVQAVFATRRPVVSRVFTSVQGFECVALHVPVFEGSTFAGSLAALIPFDRVSKRYLEGVRLGRSGHAILLSREGVELFCPVAGHTRQSIFQNSVNFPEVRAMAERMLRGETGRAVYDVHGQQQGVAPERHHAYFTRIPLEDTFWSIAVVAEEGEALTFFKGFRNRWLIGFALLFLATFAWSVVLVRAYVKLGHEQAARAAQQRIWAAEQERERAMRESAERFRTYFEGSPLPMAITSPTGEWVAVNDRLTQLLGYSREELFAIGWERLVHPDDASSDVESYRRMLAGEIDGYSQETRFLQKDGAVVHAIVSARLARRANGAPDYCLTQFQDVTDRKRLDEERSRLEEQLRQSQKLEAIGRLAGGIAHDYNNLLVVQLGHLAMLREEPDLPSELQPVLGEIEKSAAMAAQLTRQLLAFGRRQVLQIQRIDLNDVVRRVTQLVERVLPAPVSLEVETSPRALWVDADSSSLEQVVMNLVVNARDALASGGRLAVSTSVVCIEAGAPPPYREARPGTYACLSVADTGSGMSDETRRRIFEPFFTTKDPGQGTGLGLATVYGIVQQHGGWIDVETAEGKGSTFRVGLGLAPAPVKVQPRREVPTFDGEQELVLVAEDDPSVRAMLSKALGRLNCRVVAAASAAEAVEIWRTRADEVRLLLSDMVMVDGESGLELAARLRGERPDLCVIIMSGYSEELVGASLDPGMVFLAKPWTQETLITSLATACRDA